MVDNVLIQEHYDDILRVAGSLLQRATTAWEPMRALRSRTHLLATLGRGDRAGRSSEDQDALVSACVGQRGVRSSLRLSPTPVVGTTARLCSMSGTVPSI
jgi:hypothetical protein